MSKFVSLPVEVPNCDYCWGPPEAEQDEKEFCYYLSLGGGVASCVLGFDIDSPAANKAFVKKHPDCIALKEITE